MSQNDASQFDKSLIGSDGPETTPGSTTGAPYRLGEVRIDGIAGPTPAFQAGASASLSCRFSPVPGAADHIQRYRAIRDYREYAGEVTTYTSQGRAYYRETHPGIDGRQLALFAPLAADARGTDPKPRDSSSEPMWVVVTEVEDATMLPETVAMLDVEVTLIARQADHPTRAEIRDAAERNGFGV